MEREIAAARRVCEAARVVGVDCCDMSTVRFTRKARQRHFMLPTNFEAHGGRYGAEMTFMRNFVECQMENIQAWLLSIEVEARLSRKDLKHLRAAFDRLFKSDESDKAGARKNVETQKQRDADVRDIASAYNRHVRLRTSSAEKKRWPRENLVRMERRFASGLLPPPFPCEYVHSKYLGNYLFSADGSVNQKPMASARDWIGHGYAYYQCPVRTDNGASIALSNTGAGDVNTNFDTLEDNFVALSRARVLCADYDLIRRDFSESLGAVSDEKKIDAWLLRNAAFISEGQLSRIRKGGDLHNLLNVKGDDSASSFVDTERRKSALRQRSGGRAATFLANDTYSFTPEHGDLCAEMLDVKGIGTHKGAAFTKTSHTGLLGISDALRSLAMQRLVQRICEIEGEEEHWSTVKFYAIIDTGLSFLDDVADPATNVKGQMCVLAVRQAQSRLGGVHDSHDMSAQGGNLLLAGDTERMCSTGNARRARAALERYGVSAEMYPSRMIDRAICRDMREHLDDVSSCWNLQADAPLTHFMDFSDYFVFPDSCLRKEWHMTRETFLAGYVLSHNFSRYNMDTILGLRIGASGVPRDDTISPLSQPTGPGIPAAMEELFGTRNQIEAYRAFISEWRRISATPLARSLASKGQITSDGNFRSKVADRDDPRDGLIVRGKSCGSMNWFMELDVMTGAIWKWAASAKEWLVDRGSSIGVLEKIDSWLPTERAPRSTRLGVL